MAQKKWLVSDDFKITIRSVNRPGAAPIDLIMIVEPDDGIKPEIANALKSTEFGFQTSGKGYWLTGKFITKDRKINLLDFGKALIGAGIRVRSQDVDADDLKKIHDYAITRGKSFALNNQAFAVDSSTATIIGFNLQGEDVYKFESGVRAIPDGQNYILSTDAKSQEDNKRFLLNGTMKDGQIDVDAEFATAIVQAEIKKLKPSERWSEESTIKILQLLLNQDVQDASNLVDVVNAIHKEVNKSIEARYLSDLSPQSITTNGEMKALRISSASYSKLLPEFNSDGDKVQNYLAPMSVLAKRKLEESGIKLVTLQDDASLIESEFNNLADDQSMIVLQAISSHSIDQALREQIERVRKGGELITAFELKDTQNADLVSLYRVMKFKKSSGLANNANAEVVPESFMSTSQFSESISLIDIAIKDDSPLPLNRKNFEDALKIKVQRELKEVEFVPSTTVGSTPSKYVVPASLAAPQRKAVADLIEQVGDLGLYLSDRLQMDINKINEVFSKLQVEHISMAIYRHENGNGFVIGDGTGTGKTRQMAALMRYQVLKEEQIFFGTPDKQLLRNLWREIKVLDSDDLINPFVAATDPIKDDDGVLIQFANGETSENHHRALKKIIQTKGTIPGKYNAVFTTYSTISSAPMVRPIETIANYNPNFDKPFKVRRQKEGEEKTHARLYDQALAFAKFASRADTCMMLDESHLAVGDSNTKKAIEEIKEQCSGQIFASATAMKNAKRVAPYADAMRVPLTPNQLEEILTIGGEPALEAFAASLTEEGGYVRAEMPSTAINYKFHEDEQNHSKYQTINDAYAEIMHTYLRIIAYVSKARSVAVDQYKRELDPENFKPSANSELNIGINTTGFTSRFTTTNALFVSCLKAEYVAQEAIQAIRSGEKVLIPLELTSEANLKFIQETYDLPKFSRKQVIAGEAEEWVAREKAKDPKFKGVPDNFKDVLNRMFIESRKIKIPHLEDGVKVEKLVDLVDLVKEHLNHGEIAEFEDLMDQFDNKLETFPELTANPYDYILNRIRDEGFTAEDFSGRHLKVAKSSQGESFITIADVRGNEAIHDAFLEDKLDVVVMGRAGFIGIEWHATKDRPVTMILVNPPNSADLEQQLYGRINRTGQTKSPTVMRTSTGLLVEKRLLMQSINRTRLMNATSKGDANKDANEGDVQLFTRVGEEAVKRFLYNNIDSMEKLGLDLDDIEKNYSAGASIATVVTARAQMLKDQEARLIMAGIDREYYSFINELAEQGIEPFGQPTLDVEAKLSKAVKVDGIENSDNPWTQPVYLSEASYTERLVIQSSADVLEKIKESEEPKHDRIQFYNHQLGSINQLKGSLRFDAFAKQLLVIADDTYRSIRSLTNMDIEDIDHRHGKLNDMRKKYERATEMSNLLKGMKAGQIVRLSLDATDMSAQEEGVVVDISMETTGGYSPTMIVAVPGRGELNMTAVTVDKFNVSKTALMFGAGTSLANKFDTQDTTYQVDRVAVIGSAFSVFTTAARILKSHGRSTSNSVKIVNMTVHDEEKGKYLQKVALLPKDMSLISVLSSPMQLNAAQCANYIRFAGDHVRKLSTAISASEADQSDLTLTVTGSDASGGRVIIISGVKSANKKLCEDAVLEDFGVDSTGEAGFGGPNRSKYAQIEIRQEKIYEALKHLEEVHNIKFFSQEFGMRFIQDFNSASLPSDYKEWLKNCRDDLLAMNKLQDANLSINQVVNNQPASTPVQATKPGP